ncbi:MAG: Ppx/GppA family phosphatase [Alphaproteobacteria bacterium]|nr:Ppx/GppA family phosphatase [Alphaproteobacteria bacterium]
MRFDSEPEAVRVERRAVVDIGSNSIRLVIYDGPSRAPIAICNEKALCGLGRDITSDGKFNADAVTYALATLKRFARILAEHGNPPTFTIATAAVREAKDGKKFVNAVTVLGFDVRVISGPEEAALAANGVISFEPDTTGIVGDMGGGSLELVALKSGEITQSVSLPIGPFNVMRHAHGDAGVALDFIGRELDSVKFLKKGCYKTLYSVGGAWRAVARIHMRLRSYPLSILHHYEMTSSQAIEICDLIAHQSDRSLEDIPGIPRRRLETLPYAAAVLKVLLERTGVKNIVISAGGVREGILYQNLPKTIRKSDPLIAACRFYADRLAPNAYYGEAAFEVIEPVFDTRDGAQARLRFATSLLVDIGAYFHPEMRARQAYDEILRASLMGISHRERVWMALALYCRYQGRSTPPSQQQVIGLLSWEEQQSAIQFGLALRFAATFSPKASRPLEGCQLEIDEGCLVFRAPQDREELMGEAPQKRLGALAEALDLDVSEIYEG